MISCKTKVLVKHKTASQVFDWMVNLNQERYLAWHPDHTRYEVRQRTPTYLGSVVYYEQKLEGSGANLQWQVIQVVENEYLLYKARFIYPIHMALTLTDVADGVLVSHDLRLGFEGKILSRLFDWFVRRYIFTARDQAATDAHAQQELKNLEKLLD